MLAICLACAFIAPVRAQTAYNFPARIAPRPLSLLNADDTDVPSVCAILFAAGWGNLNNYQFKPAYDTLKLYLEHCYQERDAQAAFTDVNAAVDGWSAGGPGRWPDYLSWLKSVLYLKMDTDWYCDDVGAMFTALQVTPDNFDNLAAREAVAKYIVSNNRCPNLQKAIATMGNASSHWRHQYWLDSIVFRFDTMQPYGVYSWWVDSLVNIDTLANPYDSTIPSLQQVDLQILLGPQNAAVQPSSPITSQALLNAQILDNPMQDEIDFSFEMGRTALVTLDLRDILGRTVPLTYAKYQLEQPGTHEARIPAPNLPPGTYYLRITTDTGDVITLKMVKQ
jgi:hypothetical protein